ncbi:hypothetical protein OAQ99_04950 [Candidatus Kapabacteria bacterium]|nr:hypothetical protein [Candidatus Kapabacteria bacterium]
MFYESTVTKILKEAQEIANNGSAKKLHRIKKYKTPFTDYKNQDLQKGFTFLEQARILTKHHNEDNFCGVIAFANATDIAPSRAKALLAKHCGRKYRRGTPQKEHLALLIQMGYTVEYYPVKSKTLITVQRELKNTKGVFYISTPSHISCFKDGVMQDWSNNTYSKSKKSIYYVLKITPTDKVIRY